MWVAGSTHEKEEVLLLDAHAAIRARFPDALLVLVPRHPPRFGEVAELLERRGVPFVTRQSGAAASPDTQVFLLNTLGELPPFYAAGDVAFVGGSLVPIGGHNLLEPAALGLPVVAGPHNFNSADIARMLVERGAVSIAPDSATVARVVGELLADPAARERMGTIGRKAVDDNRGAVGRLMEFLGPLLP